MNRVNDKELAKVLGVRRSDVRRWGHKGFIKPVDPKAKPWQFDLGQVKREIKEQVGV